MTGYIFEREDGFYTIELNSPVLCKTDDDCAYDSALCNPGTLRVSDLFGKQIYPKPERSE